jgi:hypothetical protein
MPVMVSFTEKASFTDQDAPVRAEPYPRGVKAATPWSSGACVGLVR